MSAYYNEIDPFAAAWLRELIKAGLIAQGEVDERDIRDVLPSDVKGFTQCHFFAGIGGWSYALRLAGWPDDKAVWTGSCPCQPFSVGGKQQGINDDRHLWPIWRELISISNPTIIFGEQVTSPLAKIWLAGVRSELEHIGYRFGAASLCGPCVSAPHNRSRYFFVADSTGARSLSGAQAGIYSGEKSARSRNVKSERLCISSSVADTNRYHKQWWSGPLQVEWNAIEGVVERRGRQYRAQWRLKPGLLIVAHGVPNRVGTLCGAGNAIVPQVAQAFIESYMEARA